MTIEVILAVTGAGQIALLTGIFFRMGHHSARIAELEKRTEFKLLKG